MGTMGRHCLKRHSISPLRCILLRQFFYSASATTATEGTISTAPDSLSSLANLLVGSLGFSEKQALSTSTKLSKYRRTQGATEVRVSNFLRNADLVISFLHQKGLQRPQIRDVVCSVPQILTSRIKQNLEPKIAFFEEAGFSVSDFADVISTQPAILCRGLRSTICPAIEALREIVGSNEDMVRIMKGFKLNMWSTTAKHLVYNVSSLRARGIPIEFIQKRLLHLSSFAIPKPETFKDIMAQAEAEWGVSPSSPRFLSAVHVLSGHNEKNIESKRRVFESFGWDRSHVVDLFRRNPNCLTISEGNIESRLRFFMNELGYDPDYIARRHNLMSYSFQKRVLPRHLLLKLLKEKGLIKENFSLYRAVKFTESQFLERFIQPFEKDVPNLRDTYIDSMDSSAKEQDKKGKNVLVKTKPYSVSKL